MAPHRLHVQQAVHDSVGQFHLVARDLPWQRVSASAVELDPVPGHMPTFDAFGNAATFFHLTDPHEALTITATSDYGRGPEPTTSTRWHGRGGRPADAPRDAGGVARRRVRLECAACGTCPRRRSTARSPSRHRRSGDRPDADGYLFPRLRLRQDRHHRDERPARAGVCQDFAHVALACCARTVSPHGALGLSRDAAAARQGTRVRCGRIARPARGVAAVLISGSRSTGPTTSG